MPVTPHPSSFRDPSGFVFLHKDKWYRAVQKKYQPHFDALQQNGLYAELISQDLLIAHEEVSLAVHIPDNYKILLPEQISFQTYPYEWCFNQWKDAALLTLDIALIALAKGFILKDASSYNIYFDGAKPKFLDTLSFEPYDERRGWIAFHQYCRHFLYPLLWMSKVPGLRPLSFIAYPDGVDVQTLKQHVSLSKFNLNYALYIHLPARLASSSDKEKKVIVPIAKQKSNLQHLRGFVASIKAHHSSTKWNNYYDTTILSNTYLEEKKRLLSQLLSKERFERIVDLGANEGAMSLVAIQHVAEVLCCDYDATCIDRLYQQVKQKNIKGIYPFVTDLMQPAPATGWMNEERVSWRDRLHADAVMALALVHHLRIAYNVPWDKIFKLLHHIAPQYAMVEFVPKEDDKVQILLAHREDIFSDYQEDEFLKSALPYYQNHEYHAIPGSSRKLFVFTN